jgi:hypothetical protein
VLATSAVIQVLLLIGGWDRRAGALPISLAAN